MVKWKQTRHRLFSRGQDYVVVFFSGGFYFRAVLVYCCFTFHVGDFYFWDESEYGTLDSPFSWLLYIPYIQKKDKGKSLRNPIVILSWNKLTTIKNSIRRNWRRGWTKASNPFHIWIKDKSAYNLHNSHWFLLLLLLFF